MTPTMQMFQDGPQFGDRIRRVIVDGVIHFSVLDVFQHYGSQGSADAPSKYWKRVEKRLSKQSGDVLPGLVERVPETGGRPSPYATFKLFMRIVQVSEIQEWEAIRDWMAGLAEERIEEAANPELIVDRAEGRYIDAMMAKGMTRAEAHRAYALKLESTTARNSLTDALKDACIEELARYQYAKATNTQYENLFCMTAKEISQATGQRTAKDGLTEIGRQTLMLADLTITRIFRTRGKMTFAEELEVVRGVCADYGLNARNIEKRLGISIATGLPLLTAGNAS